MTKTNRIIALSTDLDRSYNHLRISYTDYVMRTGNMPFVVPFTTNRQQLQSLLQQADMLLLTGGDDVDPALYGEERHAACGPVSAERDAYEWTLLDVALGMHLPVMGICRGLQVLNVYFGGTLYQDLAAQYERSGLLQHRQTEGRSVRTHQVCLKPDSLTARWCGTDRLMVNSLHHQAVKRVAEGMDVVGTSADGVIEALEHRTLQVIGVQWHPEELDAPLTLPFAD